MKNCKSCGLMPTVADVGGNVPYYEISCRCENSVVVGSYNEREAITTWDILNERRRDDGRTKNVYTKNN